jgi:hypothetical protein
MATRNSTPGELGWRPIFTTPPKMNGVMLRTGMPLRNAIT